MFDLVSANPMIQTMDRSLTLATRRMALIASNMANIDTPGYRTQDFDFHTALKSEMTKLDGSQMALARTDPRHLPVQASGNLPPVTDAANPNYERNDGNDVSLDRESQHLADTQIAYQLSSNFAQLELRRIYGAIRDGKA